MKELASFSPNLPTTRRLASVFDAGMPDVNTASSDLTNQRAQFCCPDGEPDFALAADALEHTLHLECLDTGHRLELTEERRSLFGVTEET
jgi:hypothetical protein